MSRLAPSKTDSSPKRGPAWIFQPASVCRQPRSGLSSAHPSRGLKEAAMRFYNQPHAYYCGVDLHARSMFTHVLDQAGVTVFARDLAANPQVFLDAVAPFRTGLVVGLAALLGLHMARRGFWDALFRTPRRLKERRRRVA